MTARWSDLDRLSVSDPAAIGYIAHALNNYLTVATATVELLQLSLSEAQPEVIAWLDGLHHLADLMQHTVGKLLGRRGAVSLPLETRRGQRDAADGACLPIL